MSTIDTDYQGQAPAAKRSRAIAPGSCSARSWACRRDARLRGARAYLGRDLSGGPGWCSSSPRSAASSGSTWPPPRAASSSRSGSCSGWACCSGWPSPPYRRLRRCQPGGSLAVRRSHGGLRRRARRLRLRNAPGPLVMGPHAVLGAAGADRVRDRRDLRFDPQREHHLRGRGTRDLRGLHDLRLQPAAPIEHRGRPPIAASIFLDIFNVFLFWLNLFGE